MRGDFVFEGGVGFLEARDGVVEARLARGGDDDCAALLEGCFGGGEAETWWYVRMEVVVWGGAG